jgi:hypothetical protein
MCCGEHKTFEYLFVADPPCDGEYNITLFVNVRGGALGPMQVTRILGPLGGQVEGPEGVREVLESPKPGSAGPGNTYSFEWPWKQARCGPHSVALDASTIPAATGYQLFIRDNPRQFTIDHDGQRVGLVFRGDLFVPEGGPPPPPKQPQEAAPSPEGFPPEGFPADQLSESYPSDYGLPAFAETATDELWRNSESEIDPQAALLGGLSLGGVPGHGADGPPWTQMDIVVDPNASMDARGAVDLHGIEGSNMVRGLFDGRFRGFVPGL